MPHSKFGIQLLLGILLSLSLFLSGLFVVLTPLPLLFVYLRVGRESFLTAAGLSLAVVVLIYRFLMPTLGAFYGDHPAWSWLLSIPGMHLLGFSSRQAVLIFGLVYYLFFISLALVLGRIAKSAISARLWGWTPVVISFTLLGLYLAYCQWQGRSPLDFPTQYFNEAFRQMMVVNERGGLSAAQVEFLKNQSAQIIKYSVYLSPAILYGAVVLTVSLNLMAARRLFLPAFPEMARLEIHLWRLPFYTVWILIVALGGLLGSLFVAPSEAVFLVAVNLLIGVLFLFYLQGLNLVSWFLNKKGVRPLMRGFIYLMILFLFQPLGILMVLLGLTDQWANFRKLPSRK